jgi:hypothetical protein
MHQNTGLGRTMLMPTLSPTIGTHVTFDQLQAVLLIPEPHVFL